MITTDKQKIMHFLAYLKRFMDQVEGFIEELEKDLKLERGEDFHKKDHGSWP